MNANIYPLLHNANTRVWFADDEVFSYAPMVSVQRIVIADHVARVLLKSHATVGYAEPNPQAFPIMHFASGMDIQVLYGGENDGRADQYNSNLIIAAFEKTDVRRLWIGNLSISDPKLRGLVPVWLEVWSEQWQLKFS